MKNLRIFLGKLSFRLLFCLSFLIAVFLIFFLISGYHAASKFVTYLPDIDFLHHDTLVQGVNQHVIKNKWFILKVDNNGRIAVNTSENENIMSGLYYYSSYKDQEEAWGLKNVLVSQSNDSTITITGSGSSGVVVDETLIVHNSIPKMDVMIRTRYSAKTIVNREALVAKFEVPVSEIFLKNRKTDKAPFDTEYWLQRQGVRFGNGSKSSLIYHTPNISSIQLNTENNLLFINLEYYLDHQYIRIPFQEDGGGKWVNLSAADYGEASERENFFSIYFGNLPSVIPRLMLVPDGFMAGYVFTEHADGGNIRTHRAAYFGSEDISNITDAKGGFAGHKIPVTKSVFYIDTTGNNSGSYIHDGPEKVQFLDFLDQLYSTGIYDICLHTPEDYNSNREILGQSLKFMKERFDSRTWIDHGMYSGEINRESVVCDGLDTNSKYFAADLWEQYNVDYFWSSANEIIGNSLISPSKSAKEGKFFKAYVDLWKHYLSPKELREMSYLEAIKELSIRMYNEGESNSLLPNKGNACPSPLFWQHPTYTKQFYLWPTDYVKDFGKLASKKSKKKFLHEKQQLSNLLTNWGVFINHGYYVSNREGHNIFAEIGGKIVINPSFDRILELMAQMRDDGNLYITTIKNLLDYWILTENISFDYLPGGVINVYNLNNEPINGLSLAVHAKTVSVDGIIPASKLTGEDNIFWFDIPANGKVSLKVED